MAAHEPVHTPDDAALLEEAFWDLDTPEGFRAELIEGDIAVTPPPDGNHEYVFSRLVRQVIKHSVVELDVSGNKGLLIPAGSGQPRHHLIPDATFAPCDLDLFGDAPPWMAPHGVLMVAEVTSRKPERDRKTKLSCYAAGGIPHYLLIDREQAAVTLYSKPDPAKGRYGEHHTVRFGETLPLPEPFGFELETADLL
jgi:Uma2 family endonuclease